jgi:hypothetical protein
MKRFYTTSKTGEEVEVDADLARQLVSSGKKRPEDFTIDESEDAVSEPMDLLIEQPSDNREVSVPDVGMRVGGVNLPAFGEVSTKEVPSEPMGLGEGLDWGDPVQALFPLSWSGAEQGAGVPEMMGRGVADAALMAGPGRGAKFLGGKIASEGVGLAGTRALEAGIGAGGSIASQAGFEGKVDPLAAVAYGAAPFVFPAAGMAASAPSKAVGGAMQATGRAIEQELPKTAAVVGGIGKTISEAQTPIVGNLEKLTTETPWKKSAQMVKVGDAIGANTPELAGPYMGPKSHSAQLQREAYLAGDPKVISNVEATQAKLQSGLNKEIGAIHKGGSPLGIADAGAMLQEVVPQAKKMAIQQNATRFATVAKQYPELPIQPERVNKIFDMVSGIIDDEAKLSKLGFNTAAFSDVQQELVANPTFANLNKLRDRIGQVAYAKDPALLGVSNDMLSTLKSVYGELSEAMTESVKAFDPKIGAELVESNRNISKTMKLAKQLSPVIGNETKAGENVLKQAFGSKKNVSALKEILPRDYFDAATQAFVDNIGRNAEGELSYGVLSSGLSKNREILGVALDPQRFSNLRGASEFGKILNQTYPITGRDRGEIAIKGLLGQVIKPTIGNVEGEAANIATRAAQRVKAGGPMSYPTFGATLARGAYPENFRQKESRE